MFNQERQIKNSTVCMYLINCYKSRIDFNQYMLYCPKKQSCCQWSKFSGNITKTKTQPKKDLNIYVIKLNYLFSF